MRTSFFILLCLAYPLDVSFALPSGAQVESGNISIQNPAANTLQINQGTNKGIINWQKFNIGSQEQVNFHQPSQSSITLNRVNPQNGASQIYGRLTANGQIWLVNPAGVWFAPGSYVSVGGLLATTADIRSEDFIAGKYQFRQSPDWNGAVENEGTIVVKENGLAALVAPGVVNNGVIIANQGTVVLGASKKFTVDFNGDQLVNFEVGGEVSEYATDHNGKKLSSAVSNNGAIIANGGKVVITAQAAKNVLDNTINMTGVVVARSVGVKNGEIILGGGEGTINVSGKLIASGRSKGSTGGVIKVYAKKVFVKSKAVISVAGDQGGGSVYLGSDNVSANSFVADDVYIDKDATINASAISNGNGGNVVVKANNNINMQGSIFARGGNFSGNGGSVTLAGGSNATVISEGTAMIDVTSPHGIGGEAIMIGKNVGLFDNSLIDASGDLGGGNIYIGGNYQGKGPLPNATVVYVDNNSVLKADALSHGNGGEIIVWADDTTRAYGHISVQGGLLGGDGGFIETSGKNYLDVNGIQVNALASNGKIGTWLLDPTTIWIAGTLAQAQAAGMPGSNTSADTFTGTNPRQFAGAGAISDSFLSIANLQTSLNIANVIVTTTNASGTGVGDINFVSGGGNISWLTNTSFTVNAARDINFGTGSTFSMGSTTNQVVTFTAGRNIFIGSDMNLVTGTGQTGSYNFTAGGTFTMSNSGGIGTISTELGGITINAAGSVTIGRLASTTGNISVTSTNGSITVQQFINAGSGLISLTTTNGGPITFTGGLVQTTNNINLSTQTSVSETAGALSAAQLSVFARTGISLVNGNTVGIFTATNTTSGNITFNNVIAGLTINAVNQAGTGNISITNAGSATVAGNVNTTGAGAIAIAVSGAGRDLVVNGGAGGVNATTGNITLTSSDTMTLNGNVLTSNVNAASTLNATAANNLLIGTGAVRGFNTNLTSTSGSINQSASGGLITSQNLVTSSDTGTNLTQAGSNLVSAFSAVNSINGLISLNTNIANFTINNITQTGTGAVSLTNVGGNEILTGTVSSSGPVTFTTTGTITGAGRVINSSNLTTASTGGTNLSGANAVTGYTANNSNSGGITFANTGVLTLNGLTLASGAAGNITINNTGNLVVNGNLTALTPPSIIALNSSGTITQTGGNIRNNLVTTSVGGTTLTGANGTVDFTATNTGSGDITFYTTSANLGIHNISNTAGDVEIRQQSGTITGGSGQSTNASGSVLFTVTGANQTLTLNNYDVTGVGVTYSADHMSFTASLTNAQSGLLTLVPFTTGQLVNMGTGVATNTAGTLGLATLGSTFFTGTGGMTIGSTITGSITASNTNLIDGITGTINLSSRDNIAFSSTGSITSTVNTVNLIAGQDGTGTITNNSSATNITANRLTASAPNGIGVLGGNAITTSVNQIGQVTKSGTGAGDIFISNSSNIPLTINGNINNASTSGGGIEIDNLGGTSASITVSNPLSVAGGSGSISLVSTGNIIATNDITTTSGNITLNATGPTNTSTGSVAISGVGTVIGGASTSGLITVRGTSVTLTAPAIISTTGNVNLTATSGAILEQNPGSSITANLLTAVATTGITLTGSNNLITMFNASNSISGNITLLAGSPTLTITGITETGGSISVTNTGAIITSGAILDNTTANNIALTASSGSLTIGSTVTATGTGAITLLANGNSSSDVLFNANVSSGSGTISATAGRNITLNAGSLSTTGAVNLTTTAGAISETGVGIISANQLVAAATTGIGLGNTNFISQFQATNSVSNAITLLNSGNLALNGINNNNGNISITTAGSITSNAVIGLTGTGAINLTANNGGISIGNNVTAVTGNITIASTGASNDVLFTGGTVNSPASIIITGSRDISLQPSSSAIIGLNTAGGPSLITMTAGRDILTAAGTQINAKPSGTVTLTAGRNIIGAGAIDPAFLNLNAVNSIQQTGVVDVTNLLTAVAGTSGGAGGISINNAANTIVAINADNQGSSGNIDILNNNSLITINALTQSNASNTTGTTSLYNSGGAVTVAGNVGSATSSDVTLRSATNFTINAGVIRSAGFITLRNGQAVGNTFINNAGSTAIPSGSNYGIWSYSPVSDVVGNLAAAPNFVQYNAPFGTTPAAAGNGLFYAIAPVLNVTVSATRSYDGTTLFNFTSTNYTINSGILNNDVVAGANFGNTSVNVSSPNVGSYGVNPTLTYSPGITGAPGATNSGIPTGISVYGYGVNASGTETITPANLTYVADPATRTYGVANPTFTGNVTGFVNGETIGTATTGILAFTSAATAASNVGNYAINGSGLTANNGNYVFVQDPANATALTITPATLTYTANAASKIYGAANPVFTGTVTGFVNGDTQGSATSGSLIFTSPATTGSNVGLYAINGGGLSANNGNYIFVEAAGNSTAFTINPATLTYTANTASKVYGSANPAFNGTVTGFVLGQNQASATTGTLSFTSPATLSSNVGSYAINGSGLTANNGNYIFAQAAGNSTAFTITPATLTYTANSASKVYGSVNPAFNGTVTGFVLGQNQATATTGTLSFTSPATTASPVGSYAIDGSGLTANNGNYTFTQAASNSTALTITAAQLTYVADPSSRIYGDANPTFTGSVTGFVNGDTQGSATTGTLSFTSLATVTSDVGFYAINGSGLSASNYTFTQAVGNANALQVTQRPVTISNVTAQNKVYDSTTNASLLGTPTANNIVNGDVINVSGTGVGVFAQKDVGNSIPVYINGYNLSGVKAGNYAITLNGDNAQVTSSANITPATINATNITANSRIYDATTSATINTGTAGLSGVFGGDTVSLDTNLATGTFSDKNVANNKTVTINNLGITGTDANNYVLSTTTTTADITPYTLNVTGIVANDKSYDATTTATLSNTGTLDAPLASDVVNLSTAGYAANFATSNVGNNILVTVTGYTLTGTDAGNYIIASPLTTTANITPATINITIFPNNLNITYGPAYIFTGTEFTLSIPSATINTVQFSVQGASQLNQVDERQAVGSYLISLVPGSATGTDLSNYNIDYSQTGTVTIDPRPVNITNVTADPKVYDGTTSAVINTGSAQLGNVYGPDIVTLGIVSSQGTFDNKNVGTNKTVTITGSFTLGGADASNYVIANPPGTTVGDITPASLNVTADSGQTKVYGTANPPSYTYAATGFVSGDNVGNALTGALTRDAGENVGNYTINQGTLAAVNGNYTISYNSDQFSITPASLTITANSGSKVYGDTYTALTGTEFSTSGLVAGDSVSSVTLNSAGAINTAIVNTPPVGHYDIIPTAALGSGLSNYTINYVNGDLAVNQRPLTVSGITTTGKVYDSTTSVNIPGQVQFASATVTPLFSDDVTLDTTGITAQYVSPNAGANTININGLALTGTDVGNYSLLNPNVAIATPITPKTLNIINVVANDKVYDANTTATLSNTGALSGVIGGDNVTLLAGGVIANFLDANVGNAKTVNVNGYLLSGTSASNYELLAPQTTTTASITPAGLTVTANNNSKTYGDTVTFNGTEFSTGGLIAGDSVTSITLNSLGAVNTANVGNYAIVGSNAVGSGLSNYTISYVDGNLTVNQKSLTVTANDASKTYGDTVTFNGTEFSSSGLVNGDTITSVSLASLGAAPTATVSGGPYAITVSNATGANVGNYAISYVDGSLNVSLKDITLTPNNALKTYGNTTTFNGTEFTSPGLVNGDTITSIGLSSGGASAIAAVGNYDIIADSNSIVGTGLDNYNISYALGTLSVTPKSLSITANDGSKVYGQTASNSFNGYVVSGLVNSDSVSSVALASLGSPATANVGNYAITPSNAVGSGLSNYTIQFNNGTLSVTQLGLTITANSDSKVYGSTYVFNGTQFSASGLVNGDLVSSVTLNSTGAAATALVSGSPYAITASNATGSGLSNYTVNYVDGNLTVTQKSITVSSANVSKSYGNTYTFSGTEFTANGLVNGDTIANVSLSSSGAPATAAVGPYAIVANNATGTGLSNYNISYQNDGVLTVNPITLTITANSASKTYGDTFAFSGTEFIANGLVNGDAVSAVSLNSAGAPATALVSGSPYAIVASNATGSGLSNYIVDFVDGSLVVNPKTISVTAANVSKTYGDTYVFNGTEFTANGLVNGDAVSSVTLNSAGAAGTALVSGSPYDITASNATGSGLSNYIINYADGSLTVSQKAITVSSADVSKNYGDTYTFSGTEFTANGLVNGDTISNVDLSSVGSPATAAVGPYAITANNATGTGLSNYAISYQNDGILTVNPITLTITANSAAKTYGDTYTFNGTEFVATGLVNSDTVSLVTLNSTGAAAAASVSGSPYDINASNATGTGISNYIVSYVDGSLTVNPKAITVSSSDASKTYGTNYVFNGTEFTANGLVNGDTINTVSLSSLGAPVSSSVGAYGINVSNASGVGLGNYSITYQSIGILTADPATLTITANGLTKTYDTTTFSGGNGVGYAGFVAGDNPGSLAGSLSYAGSSQGAHDAGTYFIIPQGFTSTNYNINYVQGNLLINPATIFVSGVTADSRVYNSTNVATLNSSQLSYSGVLGSDVVNVDASNLNGRFNNKMAGNNKLITITGMLLTGSDSINYALNLAPVRANITPAVLVSNGVLANNKTFNGNTRASLNFNNASLNSIFAGDNVQISPQYSANFMTSNVGNNIPVNASLRLSGADAENYIIINPNDLSADILQTTLIDNQAVVRTQLLTNEFVVWDDYFNYQSTDNIENLVNIFNPCESIKKEEASFCKKQKLIWRSKTKDDAVIAPSLIAPMTSTTTLIPPELTADIVSNRAGQ